MLSHPIRRLATSSMTTLMGILATLMSILGYSSAYAQLQQQPQASDTPLIEHSQRFHPVVNQHGMVASQEQLASQIGRDILAKGGNAVDAATAVGFALGVTLPRAAGLGGGGFTLIWLNKEKKAIAINFRESAPQQAHADMFLDKSGNILPGKLPYSHLAAGVPGNVAGLTLTQTRYGSLPLAEVMQPAIKLAENGIIVSNDLAYSLEKAKKRIQRSAESQKIFFKPDGTPLAQGDRLVQKDLAHSLKLIAKQGPDAFYRGEIAKRIASDMQQHHGMITLADLADYQAKIVHPITGSYRGYKLYGMPPPSSGGIILIEMLNILENFSIAKWGLNSAKTLHVLVEVMNRAYADRNNLLGDPAFVKMPIAKLLSKAYAKTLSQKINLQQHTPASQLPSPARDRESVETTHYSVIDKQHNMVATTITLNYSYGNGHTVAGTGILLNNEMDDFTTRPGMPNSFGLIQSLNNAIAPGKQPLSSMGPTIMLTPDGKPFLATGTPGGSRIITTLLQFLLNVIDHQLNIASATNTARIHTQLWPEKIAYEQGISPDTLKLLQKKGHQLEKHAAMGSLQTVGTDGKNMYGASDPRRPGGAAIGY